VSLGPKGEGDLSIFSEGGGTERPEVVGTFRRETLATEWRSIQEGGTGEATGTFTRARGGCLPEVLRVP